MIDRKKIELLIAEELKEANKEHPLFQSDHEAYAVIKEECEEAFDEIEAFKSQLSFIWYKVRKDSKTMEQNYHALKDAAIRLIQESIQVAAMADKAIQSGVQRR